LPALVLDPHVRWAVSHIEADAPPISKPTAMPNQGQDGRPDKSNAVARLLLSSMTNKGSPPNLWNRLVFVGQTFLSACVFSGFSGRQECLPHKNGAAPK